MEDITPEEYDDAVRILAEELQKYPDMILTFKGFDHESGEIIVRYDISRPIFVMWLMMVSESGMSETYYSNIIEHKWGQHINYGILRKTAGAIRQKLKDNPGFAVDDGISWNDGRKTRDWTKEVIDTFFAFPEESQTSARFASLWSSRAVHYLDVALPYLVGGGEANSAAGWWAYIRRLHGSTRNTSTKSLTGQLGLPAEVWTQFELDHAALKADTTHNGGASDALQGKRIYEFLISAVIDSDKYKRGNYREILEAWGAVSSALGSS